MYFCKSIDKGINQRVIAVCFPSTNRLSELKRKFCIAWPHLDERTRRIMAATEAVSLGYGGVSVVRRACGLSRKAISKGIREIQGGGKPLVGSHRKDPSMRSHQATSHAKDKYFKAIKQHWDVIRHAYLSYEDKMPVMLLDVTEGMIYAYPYKGLKAQLSERGQASLTEQYNEGLQKNQFVIFVRDNEEKKLMSYSMNRPVVDGSVPLDRYELTLAIANTDPWSRHSDGISSDATAIPNTPTWWRPKVD